MQNVFIVYEFLFVDVSKIYFLREIIFVGRSFQTNLGANLFSQKVCKTFLICKHLEIFRQIVFQLQIEEIPPLCSTNILIYIRLN